MKFLLLFFSLSLPFLSFGDVIKSKHHSFKIEKILQGEDVIWGMDFFNDNEFFFTERSGALKLYDGKKIMTIKGAPKVFSEGQGGLLDVKVKAIGEIKYIYLTYSKMQKNGAVTALARATFNRKNLQLENLKDLFISNGKSTKGIHFGSRLVFLEDKIFMGIGERGLRDMAQDKSTHHGSIIRLNLDGSIPQDNPRKDDKNFAKEIWSYGHRNPQGIDSDLQGNIWDSEFGPRGGDEINLIKRAANYGWPIITYGKEYWGPKIGETHKQGMEQPIKYWTPSISPSGLMIYKADAFKNWKGDFFLANLSSRHLRRLRIEKNQVSEEEELLANLKERMRHVMSGPQGFIYITTDSGKIYVLRPEN